MSRVRMLHFSNNSMKILSNQPILYYGFYFTDAMTCILYTAYISRGFYFREFRESGAIREYRFTSDHDARMRLVYTQY